MSRYLLALGIFATATGLRYAVDPLIHDQIPYFIYVAAVVVATWFCGVDGGILTTVLSAFGGNYFFVRPRYEVLPHGEDWIAMGLFAAVALGLVRIVGHWRRAETELRRANVEVWRSREVLQAATVAAEVGVWTWIPETGEVTVGASWRVVFGVEPDTVVTFQTWENAVHSDDRKTALDKLDSAWRNRSDFSAEYRVVRPDGTVRWVADRGRPFQDASGSIVGMAGVNLDITKRRNAEESALHANRLKDEFLATLSHELRTPLNAIVGWTDMLRRRKLDEAHAGQAMEAVFRNAKTLTEIINDVLDVSRIISGKVQIEMRPVDPNEVLTNAVESVRPAADAKGITIVTECGTTPFPLSADPTRLQQVFWNLLSNAVKFTPPGGEIRVASHLSDAKLQVRITDTGIGISQDFLPYVFDRFRQRDSSTTRMHGGLGLGLAIVRHLVEMHGGTVTAESAGEGHGSTFVVTIPANRFQERRSGESIFTRHVPAVESPPDDVPSLCGIRVLVVDDEEEARAVAASVLRSHGATVSVAATPTNALEDFGRFDPHVLLVDVAMPEMDGYAFIERVRTLCGPKGAAVPAIAFTAYAREEDQRRALASGFRLHLAKPVDAHTLVRAIASVQR